MTIRIISVIDILWSAVMCALVSKARHAFKTTQFVLKTYWFVEIYCYNKYALNIEMAAVFFQAKPSGCLRVNAGFLKAFLGCRSCFSCIILNPQAKAEVYWQTDSCCFPVECVLPATAGCQSNVAMFQTFQTQIWTCISCKKCSLWGASLNGMHFLSFVQSFHKQCVLVAFSDKNVDVGENGY